MAVIEVGVSSQGRTIIEQDGAAFLVMHPDGTVQSAATKAGAQRKAETWLRAALKKSGAKAGVGEVEFRTT